MAAYVSQTKTMLHSVSTIPTQILGQPPKRDLETKPKLPTKRKRESICRLGTFTKPFSISPCSGSPYDKPAIFKPIRIIGRSQLPLTFLDTSPDESFAPNRLFSACIEILETQDGAQDIENASPKVLIARYEANKTLYAIERVQSRVFSLCKLARWLKEKDVEGLWDPLSLSLYPMLPKSEETVKEDAPWWQHAAVKTEEEDRPVKRARISMLRPKHVVVKTEADDREPELPTVTAEAEPLDMVIQEQTLPDMAPPDLPEVAFEAPSPQQLLETIVQQYLDAVYMSKTSLAYFVKGPITRVRTAFTSSEEGAPPTYELVAFLRSMLLSHKAGEKKYQEKLPEVIKTLPPGIFSDDELANGTTKAKKSKKKIKLSKDGMYPQEQDVVKRWWFSESSQEAHVEETLDQRIKRRIGDLRIRETLAQMVLMLEIIALEALSTYKEPTAGEPTITGDAETQGESQAAKPTKRKKKMDDIKLQLELLLDKLCIWQSIGSDGLLDFDAKASKQDGADKTSKAGSDRLQGFCVEVIIPFYVSRLPEQAIMISTKLGGPVPTVAPKRKAAKPPTTSRKSGEPKEPDSKKSRRTLGRVATDMGTQVPQRKPTPSLHRSATDSALSNGIKRETSEVPLGAIPFQRSPSKGLPRQSMSQFKHLKGRQIDLGAPSAAVAAKLQHKKRVEEEVQEAITALKKPNRGLAAGSYADELEQKKLSSSKKRKPATTVRKILKDVQVSATPRTGRRTKDMVEATPIHNRSLFIREQDHAPPPSSNFCIPSSGVRSMVPGTVQKSVPTRHSGAGIAETPTRGPSRKLFESLGESRRSIFATPEKRRAVSPHADAVAATPMAMYIAPTKAASVAAPKFTSPLPPVFATPTKPTTAAVSETPIPASLPPPVFATPTKPASAAVAESPLPGFADIPSFGKIVKETKEPETSIYDALGWDNDDDLL